MAGPIYTLKAARIRRAIARANLPLSEAADQIGISRVTLTRLLNGHGSATPVTRRKLLSAPIFRGLDFDDLFEEIAARQQVATGERVDGGAI